MQRRVRTLKWSVFSITAVLALGTAVLVWQAWSKVKWQQLHLLQGQAQERVASINERLSGWLQTEERRSAADYNFLTVQGDPEAGFVSLSPLSELDPVAAPEGVIGYFRIDQSGRFSSPLVPENAQVLQAYGLEDASLPLRKDKASKIAATLVDNAVVEPHANLGSLAQADSRLDAGASANTEKRVVAAQEEASSSSFELADDSPASNPIMEDYSNRKPDRAKLEEDGSAFSEAQEVESSGQAEPYPAEPLLAESADVVSEQELAQTDAVPASAAPAAAKERAANTMFRKRQQAEVQSKTQAVFDELNAAAQTQALRRANQQQAMEPMPTDGAVQQARQMDFEVDKQGERDSLLTQQTTTAGRSEPKKIGIPNFADPYENEDADFAPESRSASNIESVRIDLFAGQVDPFSLAVLESGHLVLFRKVLLGNDSEVQGILIAQDPFMDWLAGGQSSSNTNSLYGAEISLLFRHAGDVLGSASTTNADSATLIWTDYLAAPFEPIGVFLFSRQNLLAPGAGIILLSGVVMLVVLVLGGWLLFRTGVAQLQQVQQQRDFVSAVSHELRTPLTSIRMYGEMLAGGWVAEEKRAQYYQFIHDEAERLSRLIENVLQLARLERSELAPEIVPMRVTAIIDMLRSRLASPMQRAGFTARWNIHEGAADCVVMADEDALIQIVINLVDNAMKFAGSGDEQELDIGVRCERDQVLLSVRDFGPGISDQDLKRIFRLFYRAEDELTRETHGTGIGLALVQQLAKAMGGEVDVRNASPGAEFLLRLPRAAETEGQDLDQAG